MFILICLIFLVPFGEVEARECAYNIPSPNIYYNGSWAYGPIYSLKTSASSCLAENMSVYFNDEAGYYFSTFKFTIEAYLMEDDEFPNEDDKAKLYYGLNTGYDVMKWNLEHEYSGNLDSAGDQTCELYMKFRLTEPFAPNDYQYFEEDMFRYTICVD